MLSLRIGNVLRSGEIVGRIGVPPRNLKGGYGTTRWIPAAFTNQQKMNTAMRRPKEEAAKLGANGILLRGAGDQSAGTVSTGTATATSQGSTTTVFGTGVSVPVIYKAASGIAIFVLEE